MPGEYRFDIALSFADEQREYANKLAQELKKRNLEVFYDYWAVGLLWGSNNAKALQNIYCNESLYCIALFSKEYNDTADSRMLFEQMQTRQYSSEVFILPISIDGCIPEGWPATRPPISSDDHSIENIADMAYEKVSNYKREHKLVIVSQINENTDDASDKNGKLSVFETTQLWQRVMKNGGYKTDRELLCHEYSKAYDNAKKIIQDVNRYLPSYTLHDYNHINYLWKTVDTVVPSNYDLNPAEVFVLGASFLFFDLGMGLAAYPEGIEDIQKETVWKDSVAALCKKRGKEFDLSNISGMDMDIRREATQITLRTLRAEKTERLPFIPWEEKAAINHKIYVIEKESLLNGYGEIIGRIAASLGWPMKRIREQFTHPLMPIPGISAKWRIDAFKLACIIRIVDAVCLFDNKNRIFDFGLDALPNEPFFIILRKIKKPEIVDGHIAFSSTTAFTIDERDAWWQCYDMLTQMDKKIREVDTALTGRGLQHLRFTGVHSIDNIEDYQEWVSVYGWKPIDTRIRATKVVKLVHVLGGRYLYGNNLYVPLRELIQNAADAIRARRYLEKENDDYGVITVTFGEEEGYNYIEVEDNGIGMSSDTLTNILLDFGNSLWETDKMRSEFPGLEQTAFIPTGQFGIGFFSVFMWGDKVSVTSNVYGKDAEKTGVLEFVDGVDKRPYLRNAKPEEYIKMGGTKIRVFLSEYSYSDIFLSRMNEGIEQYKMDETIYGDIEKAVERCLVRLCPCLDCNLDLVYKGKKKRLISANDWITIKPSVFLDRLGTGWKREGAENYDYYQHICNSMRPVYENGSCVGRLSIAPYHYYSNCCITVGGMLSSEIEGFFGTLVGETHNAARDEGDPTISKSAMEEFVKEQVELMLKSNLKPKDYNVPIVLQYSEKNTNIPIAFSEEGFVTYQDIVNKVKKERRSKYIIAYDMLLHRKGYNVKINKNVLIYAWHTDVMDLYMTGEPYHLNEEKRIVQAVAEGWGIKLEDINWDSDLRYGKIGKGRRGDLKSYIYIIEKRK